MRIEGRTSIACGLPIAHMFTFLSSPPVTSTPLDLRLHHADAARTHTLSCRQLAEVLTLDFLMYARVRLSVPCTRP